MGWNVSVWYCCTAHYVIVDQWNRSLLNLLKIPPERKWSARCLARWTILLSRTWDGDNFLGPCMYFIFPFHIVTSYTLIYTHAQLTDCEASRKAYSLSSFARYESSSILVYLSPPFMLIFQALCLIWRGACSLLLMMMRKEKKKGEVVR